MSKRSDRGQCITIKAEEPCTATVDNQKARTESEPPTKKIRSASSGLRRSPNKWTKEENLKLTALVQHYGEKKWKRISQDLGAGKTGAQCAQHWKRVLSPEIRKGHWDEIEEELLLHLVIQYGSCWKKIAKKIPQRTDIQCRYQYLKAKQSREVPWDPKEDDVLTKKVMEMANCGFAKLSSDSNISCDKSTNNDEPVLGANGTSSLPTYYTNRHFSEKENQVYEPPSGIKGCNRSHTNLESAKNHSSTGWNSSNLGLHRVVWLEVAEHMARMKLTNNLRTALECKTRFMDLTGTTTLYCSANQEEESRKCFDMKGSTFAPSSLPSIPLSTTSFSTHIDNGRVTDTTNNTINISISNNSDNNNNITITNTFSHNITINITNTHSPVTNHNLPNTTNATVNSHYSTNFNDSTTTQPLSLVKPESNFKVFHVEAVASPTLTPSNLPVTTSDAKQSQSIVVMSFLSGLDSLATAASTLSHETILSDTSSPACGVTLHK